MAKFAFSLQIVLDHKQRLEDLAQLDLAQAQATQLREETALRELNDAEESTVSLLEGQRFTGRLDLDSLRLGLGYLEALKVQIQRQAQVVQRVQSATEAKREQLVAAMQERKALEQLRQQQLDAFHLEENRREAREQDDLVVMRHVRNQINSRRKTRVAAPTSSTPSAPSTQARFHDVSRPQTGSLPLAQEITYG